MEHRTAHSLNSYRRNQKFYDLLVGLQHIFLSFWRY